MRFGLVGTGYWARVTHATAISSTPGATLAAVWGRNPQAAKDLAGAHGAAAFTGEDSIDDFLAAVDAVAFSVPPYVQARIAPRAARAGKHLLLEKPLALSVAEADTIVEAIEAAGVASLVFFTLRFSAEVRAWLTDSSARGGWAGKGWASGHGEWLGAALTPENPFNTPWRNEHGGLWDLGPHILSLLWASLGPVISVNATAGAADLTHLVLTHEGGATSTATVTLSAPPAAAAISLYVWGEAGRSIMPITPADPVECLSTAITELLAMAELGQLTHACDARLGRDIVRVLASAQEQLLLRAAWPSARGGKLMITCSCRCYGTVLARDHETGPPMTRGRGDAEAGEATETRMRLHTNPPAPRARAPEFGQRTPLYSKLFLRHHSSGSVSSLAMAACQASSAAMASGTEG